MAVRRTKEITIASIIALGANILVNLVLIPLYGAMGATIAVLITEGATTVYLIWTIREDFEYSKIFWGFWKYFVAGVISCIIIWYMNHHMSATIYSYLIQTIIGCVGYGVIIFILRAPIINIFNNFIIQRKSKMIFKIKKILFRRLVI
ncbi:polysaccharide biosynthesis C-terminal domain-containing protein [Lactococcus lactis]